MPSFTELISAFFVMKRGVLSALSVLGRGLWVRRRFYGRVAGRGTCKSAGAQASEPAAGGKHAACDGSHPQALAEKACPGPAQKLKENAALAMFRGVLRARRPALRQKRWSRASLAAIFKHGLAYTSMAGAVRLLGMAVVFAVMLPACSGGGGAALSAQENPKSRYVRQVIEQVGKMWQIYRAQPPNDVAYGSLEVIFYVNKKGKVENIRVKNTPETNSDLMHFTVDAVQTATLPPMPRDVIPFLDAKDAGRLRIAYTVNNSPSAATAGSSVPVPAPVPASVPPPAHASALGFDPGVAVQAPPPPSPAQQMMERIKERSPQLQIPGSAQPGVAAAAAAAPKGRYIQLVLGQVEKKWHTYVRLRPKEMTYGELQVVFYVDQLGKVQDVRVADDKKSYPHLTEITLRAIKDAEIPPIPADVIPLLPTNDRGRLKIEYNALIY